jgi:two-component system phosphate regulon response regulator PhoB
MAQVSAQKKQRILVVEDDPDLQDVLTYNLSASGYEVQVALDGAKALDLVQSYGPDLLLLDLMLSDISGLEVCRRVRAMPGRQPVIVMVTARGEEIDRVVGFEIGADDYVVKPFSMRELLLRVRAHLRTPSAPGGAAPAASAAGRGARRFEIGPLKVDLDGHRVQVEDQEISVSALEMRLLAYLAQSEGMVCSRTDLLTDVWHYSPGVTTRTVDTHVKRLRDKLGRAGALIQTVRGMGYRLSDPLDGRKARSG